jgi:hypothetical protein
MCLIATGVALFHEPSAVASFYWICIFLGGALVYGAIGGLLGYVVGCFIAAIFLVKKEPQDE